MRLRIGPGLAGLAVVALLAAGCSGGAAAPDPGPPSVVVTYPVLGAVVADLVGDRATVTVLMGNGVDPHDWSPSAKDIERVEKADLVVANGLGLESGLDKALVEAEKRGVPVFRATDHVAVRQRPTAGAGSGQEAAADPHFWVDPLSMRDVVLALATSLAAVGVDVADRAPDLATRLAELDAATRTTLSVVPEARRLLVTGPAFPWGKGGEIWADLVRERTKGRINIKMYPGAALVGGDQTKEYTAIRQGAIDMAIGSTINWSPQVKELNIFSMPFLMPDYKAIDALTGGEVGKEIFKILESKDTVPLAWGENGFRELSNSKKSIRKPEDLKGLKIRVVGSPLFLETFTALGANPTQMSWADAVPALSSGAVDGQENPLTIFTVAKLHSAANQKYLTLWGYVADPLILVVNKDVWKSWTPEDQKAVREAAQQAAKENITAARKGLIAPDDSTIKEVEVLGVTVTKLTDAEKAAFKKITKPIYDKWAVQIGPDLVKKAEEAVAKRK